MRNFFNILDFNSQNRTNEFVTIQNVRADIMGELEAIIMYENHLEQTNNIDAQNTIKDIINEEKLHVGQLFGLLFKLDPESKVQFENGIREFENEQ